ncbi:MAG TPA: ATP-dependent helicase [Gemmatimonadota bacterium]|nr:ATP-dependent helicase [Gemmatimonadota bacterium]
MNGFRRRATPPDEDQRRVIESSARTLRVVAAAGSGKTETIVERIARRISLGLDPGRLLVLTFDTSAARSLRERLAARLGARRELPPVATLNAFGYRLLREHVPAEYRLVAPAAEREALLQEVIEGLGKKSAAHRTALASGTAERSAGDIFGLLKNALFDPRAFDPPPASAPRELTRFMLESPSAASFLPASSDRRLLARAIEAHLWLFTAHERAMRRRGWMDFDDQKLRAWAALRKSAALRGRVQRRYREVIVDEFQDINRLDFELVRIIAQRSTLIMAGDDDQAIYGFRGCTTDYILDPGSHLGRSVVSCELRTNYRNAPNLLRCAERLIGHNRRRIHKRPTPFRRDLAVIHVHVVATQEAQAVEVASAIQSRVAAGEAGYGDVAVLYRTHSQNRSVRSALARAGIPHRVVEPEAGWTQDERDRGGGLRNAAGGGTGVELLTYFKAKGLQWDTVCLIDCNAGIVPHTRSPTEDERRLFYVAMTRAYRQLWIWYRTAPGQGASPSPFLIEAKLLS